MTLTKVYIVRAVAEQIGHTKKRSIITIETLLELIKRSLESGGLEKALDALIPLSRTMKEDVQSLKEWAKTRARIANTADDEPEDQRKLRYLNAKPGLYERKII